MEKIHFLKYNIMILEHKNPIPYLSVLYKIQTIKRNRYNTKCVNWTNHLNWVKFIYATSTCIISLNLPNNQVV